MNKKRTVIQQTKSFTFVRQDRPGKKTWFEIQTDAWPDYSMTLGESMARLAEFNDFFGGAAHCDSNRPIWQCWEFEEANNLFLMAVLKFEN